jgi:UTP:GlnB (protein PII) uridylyltransferase
MQKGSPLSEKSFGWCREKIKTHVEVTQEDETGSFSIVHVSTRDRPGLLTDIVKTLKDLNVNVISAEVRPFL